MKIFVDVRGWVELIDSQASHHPAVKESFGQALKNGDHFFTHNVAVGMAMDEIKRRCGAEAAVKFSEIIEEAHTGAHLSILWVGRRTQKEALRLARKYIHRDLGVYDCVALVLMNRRRIRTILTTNPAYDELGLKVIPALASTG
ncbi:MAG: hypothetical protein D6681_06275 [Calditrichaeota bacterium]|nr:MAG: hypothetical protein D6681_06275 [Calditrichota bacterium]